MVENKNQYIIFLKISVEMVYNNDMQKFIKLRTTKILVTMQ